MHIAENNKEFIKKIFDEHKIFLCEDMHWSYLFGETVDSVRYDFLFGEHGFFNYSLKELEENFLELDNFIHRGDNPNFHGQKRYIIQDLMDNNIYNPTHTSFKPRTEEWIKNKWPDDRDFSDKKGSLNLSLFDENESLKFLATTHPGHTRFVSAMILRKKLNKCLIYVNKKYYYENMFKGKLQEINSVEQLFPLWKPRDLEKEDIQHICEKSNEINDDLIEYDFLYMNDTKHHKETDCAVLKLWSMLLMIDMGGTGNLDLQHGTKYLQRICESSKDISEILFEKKLQVYTNSSTNLKSYFNNIRRGLIDAAKQYVHGKPYYFYNVDKFDFDVNIVDEKPKDISKLNDYKGFAIWIDKDILYDINREIYEFLVFTKFNIKLSETNDGKISVVNCRNIESNNKWEIHEEFYG